MIVLTAEEADRVRGRSPKDATAVLVPVALKDGRFFLGEEVLNDPVHEDVRDFLASLSRAPLAELPLYGPDDEAADVSAAMRVRSAEPELRDGLESAAPAPVGDEHDTAAL